MSQNNELKRNAIISAFAKVAEVAFCSLMHLRIANICSVRRIFKRGATKFRKFENNEDQNEPKIGPFSAQNQVKTKKKKKNRINKKRSSPKFSPVFAQN